MLITIPKLPFHPNIKACTKYHEDFVHVFTFGWFGDAFLSMSMQNLANLADPMSTFYKVGIVGTIAKRLLLATTQNTKTHNNQHEPLLLYPPAALLSPSMGRLAAPPTHGAASAHGSMQYTHHQVRRPCGRFLCFGSHLPPHQKTEIYGGLWP